MILDVKIAGHYKYELFDANGKLWRCIQSCQVKDCRAGCEEKTGRKLN